MVETYRKVDIHRQTNTNTNICLYMEENGLSDERYWICMGQIEKTSNRFEEYWNLKRWTNRQIHAHTHTQIRHIDNQMKRNDV